MLSLYKIFKSKLSGNKLENIIMPNVISDELIKLNPHQQHHLNEVLTRHIAENSIQSGDIVFDIGANVGYHTHAFAALVGLTGLVHAFEPNPDLWSHIIGKSSNIRLWPVAVGNQLAVSKFFYPVGSDQVGSLNDPRSWTTSLDGNEMRILSVPQVSIDQLDEAIGKKVSFVKMDVELNELNALQGMARLICRDKPVIVFEGTTPDIEAFLTTLDYKVISMTSMVTESNIHFVSNVIAMHKDYIRLEVLPSAEAVKALMTIAIDMHKDAA
jgi:FkbM family methyltransferase